MYSKTKLASTTDFHWGIEDILWVGLIIGAQFSPDSALAAYVDSLNQDTPRNLKSRSEETSFLQLDSFRICRRRRRLDVNRSSPAWSVIAESKRYSDEIITSTANLTDVYVHSVTDRGHAIIALVGESSTCVFIRPAVPIREDIEIITSLTDSLLFHLSIMPTGAHPTHSRLAIPMLRLRKVNWITNGIQLRTLL